MDAIATNNWSSGKYHLLLAKITEEDKNQVYHISYRMKEIIEVIKGLPVCEVRQLPDWNQRIHLIVDKEPQKLIQMFHRNGIRPGAENAEKQCPYSGGKLRKRFTSMIGEHNMFCSYEGETERYKTAISSFFSKHALEQMESQWKGIAEKWMELQIQKGEVNLFEAVLHLAGTCLFVGILGYDKCTAEEVDFNCQFWRNLFAPMPDELKTLETLKQEGKPGALGGILNMCANALPIGQKLWNYEVNGYFIHGLADRILDATIEKEGTLCHHLKNSGLNKGEVKETVRGMLLAGQESTGYLLGYMLYEYAKHPEMQHVHSHAAIRGAGVDTFHAVYLECLRLHPVGGALREAGEDLVLSYPCPEDESKQKLHYIHKGDFISCYTYAAGHNPAVWGETVEQFNPNRPDIDKVKAEVLPFGHSVHRCLGEKTAEKEIMTILTAILKMAKMSTSETIEESVDAFTLRPLHDIKVKFEKRNKENG